MSQTTFKVNLSTIDYDQVIEINNKVIKIQAFFRGKLALNRIEARASKMQQSIRAEINADPEEMALREYVT